MSLIKIACKAGRLPDEKSLLSVNITPTVCQRKIMYFLEFLLFFCDFFPEFSEHYKGIF